MPHGSIVIVVVAVLDGHPLSTLDVDKADGIVQLVEHLLSADAAAQVREVVVSPADGEAPSALLVLVTRDVDAVDVVAMEHHVLATETSAQPLTHLQVGRTDAQTEALALVVLPLAFVVRTVSAMADAAARGLAPLVEGAGKDLGRVDAQARGGYAVAEDGHDEPSLCVAPQLLALRMPEQRCEGDRPLGKKGAERRVAARGIAHHPLVALVAAVVTVQVVAHLVLHMVSQCGAGLVADGIVTEGQRDWLPVGTA